MEGTAKEPPLAAENEAIAFTRSCTTTLCQFAVRMVQCIARTALTFARAARRLYWAAFANKSQATSKFDKDCCACGHLGPRVATIPKTTCHRFSVIRYTEYNGHTAAENAYVQIGQIRAQRLGYMTNCCFTVLRMTTAALNAARNECANSLLTGFVGQSIIACAKNVRWMYNNTVQDSLSRHDDLTQRLMFDLRTSRLWDITIVCIELITVGGSVSGGGAKSSRTITASGGTGKSRTCRSSSMIVSYVGVSAARVFMATSATHS